MLWALHKFLVERIASNCTSIPVICEGLIARLADYIMSCEKYRVIAYPTDSPCRFQASVLFLDFLLNNWSIPKTDVIIGLSRELGPGYLEQDHVLFSNKMTCQHFKLRTNKLGYKLREKQHLKLLASRPWARDLYTASRGNNFSVDMLLSRVIVSPDTLYACLSHALSTEHQEIMDCCLGR